MIELKDCNNCQHCSPKEYEQTIDKEPHMCKLLGKRLMHGANNKHHYVLPPLPDCPLQHNFMKNVIESKNVINIEAFRIGNVYKIWNNDGEVIYTGMLINLQPTYMQFLQPTLDGRYDSTYYVYYQDIEMRGTRFELIRKFSDWFYEVK